MSVATKEKPASLIVGFRVTRDQRVLLDRAARDADMTLSELVRAVALATARNLIEPAEILEKARR